MSHYFSSKILWDQPNNDVNFKHDRKYLPTDNCYINIFSYAYCKEGWSGLLKLIPCLYLQNKTDIAMPCVWWGVVVGSHCRTHLLSTCHNVLCTELVLSHLHYYWVQRSWAYIRCESSLTRLESSYNWTFM